MLHETTTSLPGPEVLARAKRFFAERVPNTAAFPEKEGPAFLVLRGQGGEELTIAVVGAEGGTRVRGSTLMFDQSLGRFFSTLPPAPEAA